MFRQTMASSDSPWYGETCNVYIGKIFKQIKFDFIVWNGSPFRPNWKTDLNTLKNINFAQKIPPPLDSFGKTRAIFGDNYLDTVMVSIINFDKNTKEMARQEHAHVAGTEGNVRQLEIA